MKIKALVEIDLDADDYRARLRDDVIKPSDAEVTALALQYISGSSVGPFGAKVTAKQASASKIELVVTRDPDSADEVDIYIDGVPIGQTDIEVAEFHVDAGAGHDWEDWVDSHADSVARASGAVAAILRELALDAPGSQYIEDAPHDEEERALQFDRAVRGYKRLYAKQAKCEHVDGKPGGYRGYVCTECDKSLPWPVHPFEQREGTPRSFCKTCHHSEEGGNHE